MKKEIEVKFLQVDIDETRQTLNKIGATLVSPMHLMRRATIKTPEMYQNDSFVRVRDEGDKITLTYKQFNAPTIDGCDESEVIVSDFHETLKLLQCAGLPAGTYQESKREKWLLGNTEIVIDEWPWIKPYIEIEGETPELVKEVAQKMGFDWNNAVFGSVMRAYEAEYPVVIEKNILLSDFPEVKFGQELPEKFKKM